MHRTGTVDLPLHGGKAPSWLILRMKRLSSAIFEVMIEEFGRREVLRRLSDPLWFQSLSSVLAYDWHSSGTTTVVCGVLKSVLEPSRLGLAVAGGKGRKAKETLLEIENAGLLFGLGTSKIEDLKDASRMAAKVDNACLQDGYRLYHHSMILSEDGEWAIIQQGLNEKNGYARRYQWLSTIESFIDEPHQGITGFIEEEVLDMTAKESEECRKVSTDLVCENPSRLKRLYDSIRPKGQLSLSEWTEDGDCIRTVPSVRLPKRLDWKRLRQVYEIQPRNYEELIRIEGVGPATLRGLALVSEVIYGKEASWKDPVRYSFAFGGKDGVPYPVRRYAMDEATAILKDAIKMAKIGKKDKIEAIKRLEVFLGEDK
ncbi:MAG TPA: DUF763 domain-containing protein [Candidatus Syntrophoarchaeum butanivorans]|uniref:DUF763 domain-containing protein n=1 Tax=Candidatus Syntropharchaeum butanivorans TaxID=1839936 RepID=A0A7C1BAS7_9EURY|nr:DUF763 domain-containing protein [Candidatus Syntrophoarchaeum butanivorans]